MMGALRSGRGPIGEADVRGAYHLKHGVYTDVTLIEQFGGGEST